MIHGTIPDDDTLAEIASGAMLLQERCDELMKEAMVVAESYGIRAHRLVEDGQQKHASGDYRAAQESYARANEAMSDCQAAVDLVPRLCFVGILAHSCFYALQRWSDRQHTSSSACSFFECFTGGDDRWSIDEAGHIYLPTSTPSDDADAALAY